MPHHVNGMIIYSEGQLAPIVIMVLLHIHSIAEPLEKSGWPPSPARSAAMACLIANQLIYADPRSGSGWYSTEKGRAYIARLLALPFTEPARV